MARIAKSTPFLCRLGIHRPHQRYNCWIPKLQRYGFVDLCVCDRCGYDWPTWARAGTPKIGKEAPDG